MDWAAYGALIGAALAMAGAFAWLAIRTLRTWRDFKRVRRALLRELDRVAEAAERTAAAAERAGDTGELGVALARLRVTLARFAVLRAALDEATDVAAGVATFYPRK